MNKTTLRRSTFLRNPKRRQPDRVVCQLSELGIVEICLVRFERNSQTRGTSPRKAPGEAQTDRDRSRKAERAFIGDDDSGVTCGLWNSPTRRGSS